MSEEYNYEHNQTVLENTSPAYEAPAKKKSPIGSLIGMIVCAAVMLLSGLVIWLQWSDFHKDTDTDTEPEDVYFATADGQHSYTLVQYMTEPFASFEMYEKQQFYFVFDEEYYPAIVCMDDDTAEELDTYIEYTYTDDESYPALEQIRLTGYSMEMDAGFVSLAIESYYEIFGYQYAQDEFYTDFGHYYLNVGENVAESEGTMAVLPLLIVFLAAGVLLVIFIISFQKGSGQKSSRVFDVELTKAAPGESVNVNRGAGITGAFIGALIGGIAWVFIGMFGYIVGWIGFLMLMLAITGYKKLGRGLDKFGVAASIVISLAMILAAEYSAWALLYYKEVKSGIAGISMIDAFTELPAVMTRMDLWGDMVTDLVMGFVLTGVAALCFLPSYLKGGTAAQKLNNQVAPKLVKESLIMIAAVFASLIVGMILIAADNSAAGIVVMLAGIFGTLIVYVVAAQKQWKKAVFFDTEQFRVGKSASGESRSYRDIASMNQDEEGNYVLRLYSGDTVTVPAKFRGADSFAQLVRAKLEEQML